MNVQIRNSKPVQEFLRTQATTARAQALQKATAEQQKLKINEVPLPAIPTVQLPSIQLHPVLQQVIVEASSDGFRIRSQQMSGDGKGTPDPQDMALLNVFLPSTARCRAQWKVVELKQGDGFARIPLELSFDFGPEAGLLVLRTQTTADSGRLTNALPSDQTAEFEVTNAGGTLSFNRVGTQRVAPLPGLSIADLQTLAPQLGITWDNSASLDTMTQRIRDAIAAKQQQEQTPPKKQPKAKELVEA